MTDTTDTAPETPDSVVITGSAEARDGSHDFEFLARANAKDGDDFPCMATRPKMYVLLKVAAAMGDENPITQALALDRLLDKVVTAETAAHLRERWEDEEDDLDVLWLTEFMPVAVRRWFGDPTGAASGSRRSGRRTGGSSTARRRSQG